MLAARGHARRVRAFGVFAGGQEPDGGLERHHTGQLEMGSLGEDLDLMDGQGDADLTAPRVDAGQPAHRNPGYQSGDVQEDGQAELERVYPATVDQDADGGLLDGGDPVRRQADQFFAGRRDQRAARGGGDVPMIAPAGHEHVDQVDLQQRGRGRRGLPDRRFPGHPREAIERPAQALGGVCGRAEQQIRGSERAGRYSGRQGTSSSIVVMMAAGRGSKRTVYVSSVPISWILTSPGWPLSGTARTSAGGASGGRDRGRSRRRPSVRAPPVAPMATAASETMTGFGTFFEVRTACSVGSAEASPDALLIVPSALTAVTTK